VARRSTDQPIRSLNLPHMASAPGLPPSDPEITAPLARFGGLRPDAPQWFVDALAAAPERTHTEVRNAAIELLTWGQRGMPGLLLLHGNGAHADWWSHIAPFFATRYRVAALSWSGMGGSQWRETYSLEIYREEVLAAAVAGGLFESAQRPLVVGHSFGGLMLLSAAASFGEQLKGAIVVDSYLHPEGRWYLPPARQRALAVYPSLDAALARFRFAPQQSCTNLYIADHIARHAVKEVRVEDQAQPGWTWRFDSRLPGCLSQVPVAKCVTEARCPLAFIAGARSPLTNGTTEDFVRSTAPVGSPWITIPDSDHHVLVDQPLALIAALLALFECWPARTS